MERTYYRIVRNLVATEDDFRPAKDLGKRLRDPSLERQWAEEVSVYDTFERAAGLARRFRFRLGRFVVAVVLPPDAEVEVEQSGDDPRHFALYGDPEELLSFARDTPRSVEEEASQ